MPLQLYTLKNIFYIFYFSLIVGCTSSDNNINGSTSQVLATSEPIKKEDFQNISYGLNASQKLDIYFPDSSNKNNRTIIYIHGGAWYAGDKTEAVHWAIYFKKLGYTFICINYRLTHTKENNIHPSQIQDIDTALNFILSKSSKWKIQKDEMIIMGASAGGHLALLYAYKYNNDKKIKLAISLCSILDLTDKRLLKANLGDINGGTMISWYIGDTITNKFREWRNAGPLYNISKTTIPTIFVHGKEDQIIPYQQSVKAYKLLQSFKIPSQLILLNNVDHDLLSIDLTNEFNKVDIFIRENIGN